MGSTVRAVVASAIVLLACAGSVARAQAKPTAVVSMGDSYISGEAGRWAGNSSSGVAATGYDGTDRGSAVYGDSGACHRSDVAEVLSASLPVDERVDLSCSGAVTSDLLTTAEGGTMDHGEPPQGDQLGPVARDYDVRALVVSIGGNDLGFASIITACLQAYVAKTGPCKPAQQEKLAAALPAAREKVAGTIDSIRGVMRGAGYADGGYRLILQSYPSVAARAAENRYPEQDPRRTSEGCAGYDTDLDWARDEASAQIGRVVGDAAQARGAEFLDLLDLFQGHEVCSKDTRQATALDKPAPEQSEWGRPVGASFIAQGEVQEAFHPNAIGQRAFGACLGAAYAAGAPGRFTCAGAAGRAPGDVIFARTATLRGSEAGGGNGTKAKPRLRLVAHRLQPKHRGRRVCVRFTVRGAGRRVQGARVRYRGRQRRTGARGRATVCLRHAVGRRRHSARARKAGFRPAKRTFRFEVRPRRA